MVPLVDLVESDSVLVDQVENDALQVGLEEMTLCRLVSCKYLCAG